MKGNFLIVNKKIGAASTLTGRTNTFNKQEIDEISSQPFVRNMGVFTSTDYKVEASMGINGVNVLNSELFLESVPDGFVDVALDKWKYDENSKEVPIILPRSYLTMYNFGFAQSRSLPKISDGLVGMITFKLFMHGNGQNDVFEGRVIGFSNKLNTILVPQKFMETTNRRFSSNDTPEPTRLILKVDNPTDIKVSEYMDAHGYDIADNDMDAEKITYFLRLLVTIVMGVGLVISALSFYILMLSIYLLVQKNSTKLENLLLIGYSPAKVALPYQTLVLSLNLSVLAIAVVALCFVRSYYINVITMLFPDMPDTTMSVAVLVGIVLFLVVSVLNIAIIRNKINAIWHHKA